MSKVVTLFPIRYVSDDAPVIIERQKPKTPESKARVDAMAKECIASLEVPPNFRVVEQQLRGSLAKLGPMPETERQAAIKEMQIKQGKDQIASGLRILQVIAGPNVTVAHLRNELAAIDPWFADILSQWEDKGTEF